MQYLENWEVHFLAFIAMNPRNPVARQMLEKLEGNAKIMALLLLEQPVSDEIWNSSTIDRGTLQSAAEEFRNMGQARIEERQARRRMTAVA